MSAVIEISHLSKQYRLGQIGGGRVVDVVNQWLAKLQGKEDPLAKVGPGGHSRHLNARPSRGRGKPPDNIWALKDVSFEINEGEVLGIIGSNGSGKSTVLKILSRVTVPTEGEVRVKGRIASLLEVGTGFHPELTGRENIYLNGAILGMTKAEIRGKFDEIVAFSEVAQFIDTPVKRYSSGMYVRLAFAIAAHLEPEILIVDEVLAVGDVAFQKKCLGKMKEVAGEGRTILFVSHDMEAVRRLCTRGILLHHGAKQAEGNIDPVIETYFNRVVEEKPFSFSNAESGLTIHRVLLCNGRGERTSRFRPGDDLIVNVAYHAERPIEKPYVTLLVETGKGPSFTASMLLDGHRPDRLLGSGSFECRFRSIPLLPQNFSVRMAIQSKNGMDPLLPYRDVAFFSVAADLAEYGCKGDFQIQAARYTPVVVPYEWRFSDGFLAEVSLGLPVPDPMLTLSSLQTGVAP